MKYMKSFVAGTAALILTFVALLLVAMVDLSTANTNQQSGTVGWDPISLLHQVPVIGLLPGWTPFIALALLVFAAGFYWEFRRASRNITDHSRLR
jgi:TRAP-type C4-dicarboxylate transport system permease small subunit